MLQPFSSVEFAGAVSRALGWTYVILWSVSFYPQILLNWRRRSTQGNAIDFPILNLLGFVSYTISTAAFLFSSTIKKQYAIRNPISPETTVRFNDFVFAFHAATLVAVNYSQFFPQLWGFRIGPRQSASRVVLGIVWGAVACILVLTVFVWTTAGGRRHSAADLTWIDVIYGFGYIKLLCTLTKYIPQAYLNYKRQSTVGWSIATVLMDLSGSILSLLQLVIDSSLQADWSGLTGNPVKFGLSNIGMFFAAVFTIQHYILYRDNNAKSKDAEADAENSPLLAPVS